jgi:hypothetical protein
MCRFVPACTDCSGCAGTAIAATPRPGAEAGILDFAQRASEDVSRRQTCLALRLAMRRGAEGLGDTL